MRSSGSGWNYGVARLGAILGPTLGGLLLSFGLSGKALFQLATIPIGIEVLAFVILARQPATLAWRSTRRSAAIETKQPKDTEPLAQSVA
jgi:MFS family permease